MCVAGDKESDPADDKNDAEDEEDAQKTKRMQKKKRMRDGNTAWTNGSQLHFMMSWHFLKGK